MRGVHQDFQEEGKGLTRLSKSLVLGGYHEIFENKKPQINADKRGFVIAYLRSFAFICGFWIPTPKDFTIPHFIEAF
jgi:hypothetical protein